MKTVPCFIMKIADASILLPLVLCSSVLTNLQTSRVEAMLSDVGSCTFMKYYCSARNCSTTFYKNVMKDPEGDCSVKFTAMKKCVQKVIQSCTSDSVPESLINAVVGDNYNRDAHCWDGSLNITAILPEGKQEQMPCNQRFANRSRDCIKVFHTTYGANKADPHLCRLQAEAKRCLKILIDNECNYTSSERELLEIGLSDYNPFCPGNRDPGAAGIDQCSVRVETTSEPAHASTTRPATADLSLAYTAVLGLFAHLAARK